MEKLDLGRVLKGGWDLMLKDIVPLLVGSIIAGLLGILTLCILLPVLTGGLYKMVTRRVREGRTAEIGDVFSCFDQFGTLLVSMLVLAVLIGLASLFCVIPGLLLATIWIYVFPLIIDKKLGMSEAMSRSKQMVMENGFGTHLVILIVLGVITTVAIFVPIAGFLVGPFYVTTMMAMYFALDGIDVSAPAAPVAPYPPAPSAPPAGQSKFAAPPPVASAVAAVGAGLSQAGQEIDQAVKGFTQPPAAAPARGKVVCKSCKAEAKQQGAFCVGCGEPLSTCCSACGGLMFPGNTKCRSCGADLT